jgi:hypothetical protein
MKTIGIVLVARWTASVTATIMSTLRKAINGSGDFGFFAEFFGRRALPRLVKPQ